MPDLKKAFALCVECDHVEARSLEAQFFGRSVRSLDTVDKLQHVFVEIGVPRALCFASCLNGRHGLNRFEEAANGGNALAMTKCWVEKKDHKAWVEKAVSLNERNAFGLLAYEVLFARKRVGMITEPVMVQENFDFGRALLTKGAQMGCRYSMQMLVQVLPSNDPERFFWMGELKGSNFFDNVRTHIDNLSREALVVVGRIVKKNLVVRTRTLFGLKHTESMQMLVGLSKLYDDQMRAARTVVDWWTLLGLRFRVVKDIRLLVARVLWEDRHDLSFEGVETPKSSKKKKAKK
jgi:hypothetical protein